MGKTCPPHTNQAERMCIVREADAKKRGPAANAPPYDPRQTPER